jgi:thiol-disulfide isomerase/thioredoxin
MISLLLALLVTQAAAPGARITGTFSDTLVAEGMTMFELRPSADRDLPGVGDGDQVFKVNLPQFRPPGARSGLLVAYVASKNGGALFVDANLDGRLVEKERIPYAAGGTTDEAKEVRIDISTGVPKAPLLPFRCRVISSNRVSMVFTASFRVEGHVQIGGWQTKVSMPYDAADNAAAIRRGLIEFDGKSTFINNEDVVFHVGDRYVSIASADFAARTFVLKEHPAEDYRIIDYKPGALLPDFSFVDMEGKTRKLSDFRGQHVLLDFWGTWCGPCIRDLPELQALRKEVRDRGFEIIGMDLEHDKSDADVRAFLTERGVDWPNTSPASVKELIQSRFRIMGFPTMILVDPEGRVLAVAGDAHLIIPIVRRALEKR